MFLDEINYLISINKKLAISENLSPKEFDAQPEYEKVRIDEMDRLWKSIEFKIQASFSGIVQEQYSLIGKHHSQEILEKKFSEFRRIINRNENIIELLKGLKNPLTSNKPEMKDKKYFEKLLASGSVQQLLNEWLDVLQANLEEELYGNVLLISSRYNRNEEKSRKQTISEADYNLESNRISNTIRDYLKDFKLPKSNLLISKMNKNVFISYNHKDKKVADLIKIELEKEGIEVTIDSENMNAGDDIKMFIEESIKNTNVTLSLVSPNSLMSAWVAMESINTFYAQKIVDKQFIAAFIDSSFFKRDFVDKALNKIDKEIEKIKKLINTRLAMNRNITDLQTELERYNDLSHNLPKIIQRLKDSLSVNIAGDNFQAGIIKVVQSIKS